MADVVVTMRIMPDSPDIDLKHVEHEALKLIKAFTKMDNHKVAVVPVAFGLKAVEIMFVMKEDVGSTDDLETQVSGVEGVNSVEITDVRRTIG